MKNSSSESSPSNQKAGRPALPDRIYHLAEASNWPKIRRTGLHSTSVLLDRAQYAGERRDALERHQRKTSIVLSDGILIRDQRPMPSNALASCLVGLSPPEWYAMINARVFFWIDPDRLNRQRAACGARPQIVLTVDTQQLVTAYHDRITVTAINTGNARRRPAQRGAATFVPYQEWLAGRWSSESRGLGIRERSRSHRPVELTVLKSVPDIMRFIVGTRRLEPGELLAPGD